MLREVSVAFQTNKAPGEYVALAQLVDEYDFDAVSVYGDLPFHPSFGPLHLMAPHIRRARLGPAGVSPARMSPVDMAAEIALLAEAAQGGVYLGVLRGAWLTEHGIVEHPKPLRTVQECVDVVRYLLTGGIGGYRGEVYRLAAHIGLAVPRPDYRVPIMIGTWGPQLASLAGEIADEVKVGGSANPAFVRVMRGYIGAGERHAGRKSGSVGLAMGAVTVVDEDRKEARMAARRAAALYLPVTGPLDTTVHVEPELIERLRRLAHMGDFETAAELISDELLDRFAFAGNADDLIERAEALFDAGASRVEFGTPHGLTPEDGLRIIGEEVLPTLKANA